MSSAQTASNDTTLPAAAVEPDHLPRLDQSWRPSFNPWIIAVSVMLATFMEVLDTSVANVALPHIAGNLSASYHEATWVLTSYLVSNAIILPCTGWLTGRFGRKRTLVTCIAIFTISSGLCGAANSLGMLIVARIIQGIGGGALQPIAQAVLLESFPPARRGAAMAAYGMGVVTAPIIGPTLGGWITDNYSWRWIFYINLPVGILAVLMARAFVEDPPYLKPSNRARMDYIGFFFMALGMGALQIMLDKGQEADWFSSNLIVGLAVLAVLCLIVFVVWELMIDEPIVDLRIFADRNFATGTILISVIGIVLYGTTVLLPLFLQTLVGYPATQSGLAVSPRGFGSMAAMIIVGRLIGRIDTRVLLSLGFLALAYSTFMFGGLDLDIAMSNIWWPNILSGLAMGFIFVPLTTTTMATLPNERLRNATGMYNLLRNIGGGIGIAIVTTLLSRGAQARQVVIAGHISAYSPTAQEHVRQITAALTPAMGSVQARPAALALVYRLVQQQASLVSNIADFRLLGFLCIVCLPGVFLFHRVRSDHGAMPAE